MDHWRFLALMGFILVFCQTKVYGWNCNDELYIFWDSSMYSRPYIPKASWFHTPSIVDKGLNGNKHYRALGRVIHLKNLTQQLEKQMDVKFDKEREVMNLVKQLDIYADTVYVEGKISFYGIETVKIHAREIVGTPSPTSASEIVFLAPEWKPVFKEKYLSNGAPGEEGKKGINGPNVSIVCDVIRGYLGIRSFAGRGKKGQNGANGSKGSTNRELGSSISDSDCFAIKSEAKCVNLGGRPGSKGHRGNPGGNAGKPGNGGNAGSLSIHPRKILGRLYVYVCSGDGAGPAENGQGGPGGDGSEGGFGRECRWSTPRWLGYRPGCYGGKVIETKGPTGPPGDRGPSGKTSNSRGKPGSMLVWERRRAFAPREFDSSDKESFPVDLIEIMKRQAEDLLLANIHDQKGRAIFAFILSIANGRSDLSEIATAVRKKLGFLGRKGYDIFGNNKMFAPLTKWETLKMDAERIKRAAESYENDFNDMMSIVQSEKDVQKVANRISSTTKQLVNKEKERLVSAKYIAESEKGLYIQSIQHLEERMDTTLSGIKHLLPDVYKNAIFNDQDMIILLHGLTGFVGDIVSKSPLSVIKSTFEVINAVYPSKQCLGSLQSNIKWIEKWVTFGKNYQPLEDSSDLDFNTLDVSSVPEIMQVNLDMNKEKLSAGLICLLEIASRPLNVAGFKQMLESFFSYGAARIELIAKVIDLDNDIGGYSFDIDLFDTTIKELGNIGENTGYAKRFRGSFMDILLSTYRELERYFMKNVYEMYKAFEFRTLWQGTNPLKSFQRVASESAKGTGQLRGVSNLTRVLGDLENVEYNAKRCFARVYPSRAYKKWTFDKTKHKEIFSKLVSTGNTSFQLEMADFESTCIHCYNARMFKMYIQLYGPQMQPANVRERINLRIKHGNESFFRLSKTTIKHFYQPPVEPKLMHFDQLKLVNDALCTAKKAEGLSEEDYSACIKHEESRWAYVCDDPFKASGSKLLQGNWACKSPVGIYDLEIPVDKNLECSSGIINSNCKDLDLSLFTRMEVWTYFFFWPSKYPTGPEDPICKSHHRSKLNGTEESALTPEV